ncbi:MAG: thiamine pyrophosphate-dependent enzyme, partial [Anaerolineae bacterium]
FEAQPDFVQLAQACGCYAEGIEKPAEVRDALERALRANEAGHPAVLVFGVDGWQFSEGFYAYYDL